MSLSSIISDAATEAQGYLVQIQGMASTAAGNFVGPDGKTYTMVFRAADAFEQQAAGMEMQSHGFGDKSLVIATATRTQFSVAPLGWRRLSGTRLIPAPACPVTIISVATDDPNHYVFNCVVRQTVTPPSNG
jgi:hypothetical protein